MTTTTIARNPFVEQLIALGIPLALIAITAQTLGLELLSSQCIWMTVIAAALQTIAMHFLLNAPREQFETRAVQLSYYNWGAVLSVVTAVAAILTVLYW